MRTYDYFRARSGLTEALKAAAHLELEMDGQSHDEFLAKALALQRAVTRAEGQAPRSCECKPSKKTVATVHNMARRALARSDPGDFLLLKFPNL